MYPYNTKDYVFFWKVTEQPYGVFSQWYVTPEPIIGLKAIYNIIPIDYTNYIENKKFMTREHWMMYNKAILFSKNKENYEANMNLAKIILNEKNPNIVKDLGRKIKGFDEEIWNKWKYKIVVNGNYLQFSQNSKMKDILLETNKKIICEASPYDPVWGLGLTESNFVKTLNNNNTNFNNYGENLLGKALMEVREKLATGL